MVVSNHETALPHAANSKPSRRSGLGLAIVALGGVIAIGLLAWCLRNYPPTSDSWYPKCVFHQATGLHCPGCGGTRALRALALGDFGLAIRCNPLLIVGLPIILVLVWRQRRREHNGGPASPRFAWIVFVVVVVYFVGRNFPSPTASPFAPPTTPTTSQMNESARLLK